MSYQGHEVNFSQSSSFERAIGMEIGNINTALYTYPQLKNTASAKSDTDIWNHLNRYVWGKSGSQSSPKGSWSADPNAIVPNIKKNTNAIQALDTAVRQIISQGTGGGMTRQEVENIVEDYHGDDIALLHSNASSLGDSQKAAKKHRDNIESKAQGYKDEHSIFHTKLQSLGDSQTTAKTHRDSLESKIQSHSHDNGGGNGCDCNFWDIPCQMGCGVEKIIPYALIGGVALLALRKK